MGRSILKTLMLLILGFPGLTHGTDLAGTWKGFNDTPTGLGALEITFSHQGTSLMATCMFPEIDGENTFPVRDLRVSDPDISFVVDVASESRQMRFAGKLVGDKVGGTYEMLRGGESAYSGEWRVKRQQTVTSGGRAATQPRDEASQRQKVEQGNRRMAELPIPNGPFVVGRTIFYWKDSTRPETLTADPNVRRELMMTLWYPARKVNGLRPANYFPNHKLIAGRSSIRLPDSGSAHALEQAPVADTRQMFPVLLFSHGLGENTWRYSAQLEELASYGYVVAAVDHTYDNQGVVFPDGRVVRYSDKWNWAFDNAGPEQQHFILTQLRVMVADISFVVDQLTKLNGEASGIFNRKLDLHQLGFFGHSLGGAIAPLVCQTDKRFKACLNQDGLLLGQALILDSKQSKLERPFMFLGHSDRVTEETLQLMALTRTEYEEQDRRRLRRAYLALDLMPEESYVISISGAAHASFTDNPLLSASSETAYRNRVRSLQIIRDFTRAFFDKYLMNEKVKLLTGQSTDYSEAAVIRFGGRVGR
jgi:predicted dienelactone hydrolase